MPWELWIGFVLATSALLMIPGPTVMVVVGYALRYGKRSGWATIPGVMAGDFTAMTISLLGAGAVLAASAELFTIMKLLGAAYLIWLGISLWRATPNLDTETEVASGSSLRGMFVNSWLVTALNPKGIAFFIAFVPQFVVPTAGPVLVQFLIFGALLSLGGFVINGAVGVFASGAGRRLARGSRVLDYISASVFAALAARLAILERT